MTPPQHPHKRNWKSTVAVWAAFITMVLVAVGFVRDWNRPAPTITNNTTTIVQSDSIQFLKASLVRVFTEKQASDQQRDLALQIAEGRRLTILELSGSFRTMTDSFSRAFNGVVSNVDRANQRLIDREASSRAMYSDLKADLQNVRSEVQAIPERVADTVRIPVIVEAVPDTPRLRRGFFSRLFNL